MFLYVCILLLIIIYIIIFTLHELFIIFHFIILYLLHFLQLLFKIVCHLRLNFSTLPVFVLYFSVHFFYVNVQISTWFSIRIPLKMCIQRFYLFCRNSNILYRDLKLLSISYNITSSIR